MEFFLGKRLLLRVFVLIFSEYSLCLPPYIEHDFKSYLLRDDKRIRVWLFSFLFPEPLTQKKYYDIYYNYFF